jgi:outer membrane beta-barrel protein
VRDWPPKLPAAGVATALVFLLGAPGQASAACRRAPPPADAPAPPATDAPPPPTGDANQADADVDASASAEAPAPPPSQPADDANADAPPDSAAAALGRQPSRIKCLDESLIDEFGRARSRKGVQPRFFRKALRLSLSLAGGGYAGDLASTNWQAGGSLAFWITEDVGIDAQFRLTEIAFRLERAASGFTGQDRYPDALADNLAYVAHGHVLWSPFHTKLRASEDRIIHGDFVLFAGAGKTFHDTVQGVGFDVGASMYLYPTKWLSVRFDLADHILNQEILGSTRISNNLLFSAGIGIWVPFRIRS